MRSSKPLSRVLIWLSVVASAPTCAAPVFSTAICSSEYTDADANAIIRTVFQEKFDEIVALGKLPKPFVERNAGLKFVICNNPGGFDTLSVYGTGVAFDIQLIGLLMAQARALISGATINPKDQLALHRGLMQAFITQGAAMNINPIEQVEKDALANGFKASEYKALVADPQFLRREQNLFLVALNFLSLHERCHFGLDHGTKIKEILKQPASSRPIERHKLEIEADRCAMDIINADEQAFASSPISYIALMMIVTTQTIVSAYAPSPETSSHPSSLSRISAVQKRVLEFVAANPSGNSEKYRGTIEAVGAHMARMQEVADAMRASRSKGR